MKQLESRAKRSKREYVTEESSKMAKAGMADHERVMGERKRSLTALAAMQASRPLKPPGGRL